MSVSLKESRLAAESDEEKNESEKRGRTIVRTSLIGIFANVLLAGFKAVVGAASGSVAIVMDAVNNLSDAASSIITIVGTKLAGRPADKKHPFGYGRMEYLSAMVISLIVLYAGITSLQESVKKIIHPQTPEYTAVTLVIVAVAVLVKIVLGRFVKATGKRVNSDSLVNSGQDAIMDSVISASTLAAAAIYLTTNVSLEAWLGAVISAVIIKSGIDMLRETLSEILGEEVSADLARKIKADVCSFPEVRGAYDLVLNNYGPDVYNGSIHVEVCDTLNADEIDNLTRAISAKVYQKEGVLLTAISVYSYNTKDPEVTQMRDKLIRILKENPNVLQVHGFYVEKEKKAMRFDMVVSFNEKDRGKLYQDMLRKAREAFPDYHVTAAMDTDFSEE
ncbi:MAG: cation diffusion facilitator family transporter [Porcincola intestinalis]|uniref:cation diffusion facilitator family transporter n=1 Tax=Porcincola intestinalis TaxID=2606632 RepID=UPI0029D9C9CD|nr:cation diffusion facilitator family transporter [Porcincola intestinalis]MCI6239243.1 cation diffusion facilitator family transporter [Lachnospiraceae bacterium]MCI6698799.1 cation diffusion facilitator family transporter [Lachnospiraceae bacterium]MCI7093556.1 cation diffusion facilitator family transporter [Lachnospiraceae bacterium]MDY5331241.1 cation diffusion facilitator family transporter [Porcincola intestinalis]